MNRHQTTHTEEKPRSQEASTNAALSRNTQKTQSCPTQTEREMTNNAINVVVYKTMLTPKGRRFPPREPRRFELTLGADTESSLSTLRDEVTSGFPGMKGKFTILYKDLSGEFIHCNNGADLMKATEFLKDGSLALYAQGERKCNHAAAAPVACAECGTDVQGARAKCLECQDFELCQACDDKGLHTNHIMVRCERPRFIRFALPMFAESIEHFCMQKKLSLEKEAPMPRVLPKELREFWRSRREADMSEEQKENKKKFQEKKQEMRTFWHQFLAEIADEKHAEEGAKNMDTDEKDVVAAPEQVAMEVEGASSSDDATPQLSEEDRRMKRQWIQRCLQEWRQQMRSAAEAREAEAQIEGKPARKNFRMWRPYMVGCWNLWKHMLEGHMPDDQEQIEDPEEKKEGTWPNQPRRQWIQACWRLWRQEAPTLIQSQTATQDDTQEGGSKAGCDRRRCEGPFAGYRKLMNKSWQLMRNPPEGGECLSQGKIEPEMAKQMLKRCWINGARQLWWMQVRKTLDVPEDAKVDDRPDLTLPTLMKAMSEHDTWKCYMHQVWRLWKQMSKQSGLADREEGATKKTESDAEDFEILEDAPLIPEKKQDDKQGPKQEWMRKCWDFWQHEMPKEISNDETPNWDKRPFPGWRQLIIRSWQNMQEELGDDKLSPEERQSRILAKRQAWLKEVNEEMKQLSLSGNEEKASSKVESLENPRWVGPDGTPQTGPQFQKIKATKIQKSAVPVKWQKLVEVRQGLMKQYWEMWSNRGQRAGGQGCPGRCGGQGRRPWFHCRKNKSSEGCEAKRQALSQPTLKLTLSLKTNSQESK